MFVIYSNVLQLAVYICILCTLAASQTAADPRYELTVQRADSSSGGDRVDSITLRCRTISTGDYVRALDITFWRNRESVDDPGINNDDYVTRADDDMGIVFQLKRQLEGNYTCGEKVDEANVQESRRKTLITLQTNFPDLIFTAVRTYFVATGSEVTLSCPVQPGSLYQFYFGKWTRNFKTIIERREDPTAPAISLRGDTENFEIDPRTFALTIKSANVTHDASDNYRCVLSSLNPASDNRQEFTQASFISISLMVNEKPTILERPQPFTVGLEEAQINHPPTFTCVVGGAPKPVLVWTYLPSINSEAELFLVDSKDYSVTFNETGETNNGRFLVTSTITFRSVAKTDGGIVRCNTGLNAGVTVTADALLTVLGTADNINVFESRRNDIIYELIFPAELHHPVTLNITYTSRSGESRFRIPDVSYNSTRTITYKEVRTELPYPVYHVSVALVALNGSERISGPPTEGENIIDTTRLDPIIIAAVVAAAVILLIILITIIVIAVLVYKNKRDTDKLASIEDMMHNLPKEFLERLSPEKRESFLNNLANQYERRVRADGEANEAEKAIETFSQFMWDTYQKEQSSSLASTGSAAVQTSPPGRTNGIQRSDSEVNREQLVVYHQAPGYDDNDSVIAMPDDKGVVVPISEKEKLAMPSENPRVKQTERETPV